MGTKTEETSASSAPERSHPGSSTSSGLTLGQEPVVVGAESEAAKYELAPPAEVERVEIPAVQPAYEDLGDLPASYNEDTLFCTARDPRWLFCYWDYDWTKVPAGAFQYGVPMFFLRI